MKKLNQKLFSQKHFSLIFQTLEKHQIDCKYLSPKTSFDCCENTGEYEIFVQKILSENWPLMGIYSPQKNIAVGSRICQKWTTGRPANGHIWPLAATGQPRGRPDPDTESNSSLSGRPLGRPGATREQPALSRSTVRSTGLWVSQRARIRARQSTATVDWLLGTVDRPVDRPSLAAAVQVRKT